MPGDGLMTTTYDCDPDESSESVAVTVKLKLPVALGVPAIVPVELSNDRPAGSVPVDDQLQPSTQPLALSVCEYAMLMVQLGSVEGLTVMAA
jgi:hypothetical protein